MLTINDITHFKHLSNFSTLKNFNNHVEMFLCDYKSHFTKKELIILKRLIRYSAKVYGVSNISIRRLIEAVERFDNTTISAATFHRMKRKAIKFGMLEIHQSKRTDNSQSSNIYVFLPYSTNKEKGSEQVDLQKDSPVNNQNHEQVALYQHSQNEEMTAHEADNIIKTSNILNTRNEQAEQQTQQLDSQHVSSSIPIDFINAIKPYYSDADTIYSIYRRLLIATKEAPETVVYNLDDYIKTFKETIYSFRKGKVKKEYLGYLFGAFRNRCNRLINRYVVDYESDYFGWLKGV